MPDQTYPAWTLNNPLRRWISPPRRTVDRLGARAGDRVTDLGAGVGYFAEEVLTRVGSSGHLTLVDVNADNLERFIHRHGTDARVEVRVSSAASVPFLPSDSQDRVLVANVLCDVTDKSGVMSETWRILKPDGTAYVSFHTTEEERAEHSLRVTASVWSALSKARPWREVARGTDRSTMWHLLNKGAARSD